MTTARHNDPRNFVVRGFEEPTTVPAHYHDDNRCCFCGAEDDHECAMCPDYDGGAAMSMNTPIKQAKATARPWKQSGNHIHAPQENGLTKRIAICDTEMFVGGTGQANAELIVRAVNTHDALIEFLANARAIALSGDKDEAFAELRGDFLGELLERATA